MEVSMGDRVFYANDADPGRQWTVARTPRPGSQFVCIVEDNRRYPKCEFFFVPVGTLLPQPAQKTEAAPAPAVVYPGGHHTPAPPIRELSGFLDWADEHGATANQVAELEEIWATPAPNNGVRIMRMRNYIKNRVLK